MSTHAEDVSDGTEPSREARTAVEAAARDVSLESYDDRQTTMASEMSQYLAFDVCGREMALPLEMIGEIIRPPAITPVPLSPDCLPGVFSLRGSVLPVLCLRRVAGDEEAEDDEGQRILVVRCQPKLGLRVDRVHRVFQAPAPLRRERGEDGDGAGTSEDSPGGLMTRGAIQDQSRILQLLDVDAVLDHQLGGWQQGGVMAAENDASPLAGSDMESASRSQVAEQIVVSVCVDGQDFGLDALPVREILDCPEEISPVPRAPQGMLGLAALRGATVPLFSLRRLLDFPEAAGGRRVVILPVGDAGLSVGLVVDDVNEVLRIPEDEIGPVPQLGGEQAREFSGVYRSPSVSASEERSNTGLLTLIDVDAFLAVHRLVEMAEKMIDQKSEKGTDKKMRAGNSEAATMQQYVIFELDGQSFGAPIGIVKEILRLPETLTGVPSAGARVEGVINLRGRVLPVVDMRRRFGLPVSERNESQRVLVLELQGQRAGFIVDSVSEVLKVAQNQVSDASELAASRADWVAAVIRRDDDAGMVLVVDRSRLLAPEDLAELEAVS